MNDFDDRARAAGERIRRRAETIGRDRSSTTPTTDATTTTSGRARARTSWATAAAIVVALAGVAAIWAVAGSDDGDDSPAVDDPGTDAMTDTSGPTATETSQPSAPTTSESVASTNPAVIVTSPPSTRAPSTSTTSPPASPAALTRPILDPDVCTPLTASEFLRTDIDTGDLTLFARPSEFPFPIQVIGDPDDGEEKPFALVLRYVDRDDGPTSDEETLDIGGSTFRIATYDNGNGQATWKLSDGSQGYLRSRGLDRDQIAGIAGRLTPRAGDAELPGFDVAPDASTPTASGEPTLELVAEQMNTDISFGRGVGSQCEVEGTGFGYRVTMFDADPVGRFAAVIDRPPPLDVSVLGDQVAMISGPPADVASTGDAPSTADIVQADEATWLELRSQPSFEDVNSGQPIGGGREVIAKLESVASDDASYLTVQMLVTDGVPFLQVQSYGATIAPEAEYWEYIVDGRRRSLSTASPDTVSGLRLGEEPLTEPFRVTIRTVDTDGQVIQSTPDMLLMPVN